jgi:hypothetical protein
VTTHAPIRTLYAQQQGTVFYGIGAFLAGPTPTDGEPARAQVVRMLKQWPMPRESGCPVHFVWDGNVLVRAGFLLLLGAGLLWAASRTFVVDALGLPALLALVAGAALWLAGQALRYTKLQ